MVLRTERSNRWEDCFSRLEFRWQKAFGDPGKIYL